MNSSKVSLPSSKLDTNDSSKSIQPDSSKRLPSILKESVLGGSHLKVNHESKSSSLEEASKRKVRISEQIQIIEVENWKQENLPMIKGARCSVCIVM